MKLGPLLGAALSAIAFSAETRITSWELWSSAAPNIIYPVTTPCTVFACLMQSGLYPDPFYAQNINNITTTPFNVSWWYSTTISPPQLSAGGTASLQFKGLNYRANVFVDGVLVGSNATVAGAFRYFEFDVTSAVNTGHLNVSVQVFPQHDRSLPSSNHDLDLGITFVDWAPTPPDNNAGLWRDVVLITRPGPVALRNAGISVQLSGTPDIPQSWPAIAQANIPNAAAGPASFPSSWPATPSNTTAYVNVSVQATNYGSLPFSGLLLGTITAPDGVTVVSAFSQQVILAPSESQLVTVAYDPAANPNLSISNAQLWWPWQMGPPQLHVLNMSIVATTSTASASAHTADASGHTGNPSTRKPPSGSSVATGTSATGSSTGSGMTYTVSDTLVTPVGLRETAGTLDANGNRLFSVNRYPILIRGAGWSPDLFLRFDSARVWAELAYTRDMGLNAVRLEGKMEPDEFFDYTDRLGLLTLPGWCCCDAWQHWPWWTAEQYTVSAASMRDQAARLRAHPSVLTFFLSSDQLPPANVEAAYLAAVAAEAWPNPTVSAASVAVSNITGSTGVKMSGPYSWVPANYWLLDNGTQPWAVGGAWGFLTEGGPGENPLPLETLNATIPSSALWPPSPDNCWGHCGSELGMFGKLTRFNGPLAARYGNASTLQQYLWRSHAVAYEGHRAMFEGYTLNKYTFSTGVIQWMLNTAWPANIWHLFDWFLQPGPTYAATKKACEPLHIMYNYADNYMWATNSWYTEATGNGAGFLAQQAIVAPNGTVLYTRSDNFLSIPADGATQIRDLPTPAEIAGLMGLPAGSSGSYFVRLLLLDGLDSTRIISENAYWLSLQPDVLDWEQSTWYNTPCTSYADYTALTGAQAADVVVTSQSLSITSVTITLSNRGPTVAWLVKLRLIDASITPAPLTPPDIVPVQWSDNYVTLLPGESRTFSASFVASGSAQLELVVSGLNVGETRMFLSA